METPSTVGQFSRQVSSPFLPFAQFSPARPAQPVAFELAKLCFGRITWHVDHTHHILTNAVSMPMRREPAEGDVAIPHADVLAGAQKTYVTSWDNDHTHTFTLTAAEMSALRNGGTIRKETSRNARQGGRQHTHTVNVSCLNVQTPRRTFSRPLSPFRPAVYLAGPYGHLGGGTVGQAPDPAFRLVNGLQQFPAALAQSIATNLAAMYWQPSGATRTYIAFSPAEYERVTGNAPPSVGYPPEASEPGAIILVNPATIQSVNGPLDQASVIVAGDRATAAQFAGPGGMYGVVFPLAAEAPARRQVSPAVIAAGVAAAVAALLIFT